MLGCGYHRSHTRHWFFVDHGFIIVLLFFHYFPVYVQEWSFSVLASPRYLEIFSTHLYSSLLIIYDTWLSDYSVFHLFTLCFSLPLFHFNFCLVLSTFGVSGHTLVIHTISPFSTSIHFSPVLCDFYGPPFWFCFQLQLVLMVRRYKQIHFLNTLGLLNLIWMLTKKKKIRQNNRLSQWRAIVFLHNQLITDLFTQWGKWRLIKPWYKCFLLMRPWVLPPPFVVIW